MCPGRLDQLTCLPDLSARLQSAKAVANASCKRYIADMSKSNSAKQHPSSGVFVKVQGTAHSRNVTTKLGNVSVSGKKPSAALVKTNVAASTAALERVGKKLTKPGVRLSQKKGVPRYSADENNPGVIIRKLDGQVTTGRLQNGQFVEVK